MNYRESFGIHASCGILFNHESPLRGREFVTRKISLAFARMRSGLQEALEIGNLDSRRDWGFAGDYVEGMWRMLQQEEPGDYVLATGETHSVREFAEKAAQAAGYQLEWKGQGVKEQGCDKGTGKALVRVNPQYYRPAEVDLLRGNAGRIYESLGWKPTMPFDALVELMVQSDLERTKAGAVIL